MSVSGDKDLQVFDEAYKGNLAFVREKVDKENSLIRKLDTSGRTLLHWAALNGNEDLVRFLIDSGSQVDLADDIGMTPLILASSAGRLEACHLLLSKNAEVNAQNNEGHSALQYAASKGWCKIIELLLKNQANVNIADNRGATPIHRAASKGMLQALEALFVQPHGTKININAKDVYGNTALHLSCEENRVDEAKFLLAHGAKADVKNKEGQTALDLAPDSLAQILRKIIPRD